MKFIKAIARTLVRPAALALLALFAFSGAAKAANIKMECKVAGYSLAGWIEVRPGSGTGGRVQRDSAGRYYTDRVQRGEAIRVNVSATTAIERCLSGALTGAYWDNGGGLIGAAPLPFSLTGRVPTNVNVDNLHLWVYTNSGFFDKRVPIGSR